MKSAISKHSMVVNGHKTSISLEDQFWNALKEIASTRHQTLSAVVSSIGREAGEMPNLSSAVRQFVFTYFRSPPQIGV